MSDQIKVGILGLEHPHADFWRHAFNKPGVAELVGVWAPTPGLAAQKAEKFGCPAWDEMAQLVDACDAVAICSITTKHAELIEFAAKRGKKILCEKPLATTAEDCDRIEAALRETGAYYMQGFPKRFDPVNHEVRRIVTSGALGTISLIRIRHGHPVAVTNPHFADTWFVRPDAGGGGALLDEGVHGADFIRWLFGDPQRVTCVMSDAAQNLGVEDVATAIFQFSNGMMAEITSAWHFLGAENSVEIFGTKGAVVLSGVDLGSRDLTESGFLKYFILPDVVETDGDPLGPMDREWTISDIVPQFKSNTEVFHQNVADAFIDAISNGKAPPITVTDGRRAVEMILAAYKAAASGKTETIAYG